MSTPFLGEVRIISFNFPPKGWAFCNGQFLPINQNQGLFAILGTTYGGNGQTTFALPNLQGRTPIHMGAGFTEGEAAGQTEHTVTISELPAHNHPVSASSATPDQGLPTGNQWGTIANAYATTFNTTFAPPSAITNTGGSQPHNNLQPYLVLNFIIALQGIFPSQN